MKPSPVQGKDDAACTPSPVKGRGDEAVQTLPDEELCDEVWTSSAEKSPGHEIRDESDDSRLGEEPLTVSLILGQNDDLLILNTSPGPHKVTDVESQTPSPDPNPNPPSAPTKTSSTDNMAYSSSVSTGARLSVRELMGVYQDDKSKPSPMVGLTLDFDDELDDEETGEIRGKWDEDDELFDTLGTFQPSEDLVMRDSLGASTADGDVGVPEEDISREDEPEETIEEDLPEYSTTFTRFTWQSGVETVQFPVTVPSPPEHPVFIPSLHGKSGHNEAKPQLVDANDNKGPTIKHIRNLDSASHDAPLDAHVDPDNPNGRCLRCCIIV